MSGLLERGWRLPDHLVGTSAGAAIAVSCLTIGPRAALESCCGLLDSDGAIKVRHPRRLQHLFPLSHEPIYRKWVRSIVDQNHLTALRSSGVRVLVAISRPSAKLGLSGSVVAGTLAYAVDQFIAPAIHPRLPGLLGLEQEFVELKACDTVSSVCSLLRAAAAAVPYIRPVQIAGYWALDGGYVDNAPIPAQSPLERDGTLVLLTRHDSSRPTTFVSGGRTYWQPSRPVPVSTWDCSVRAEIRAAFDLGRDDALMVVDGGLLAAQRRGSSENCPSTADLSNSNLEPESNAALQR